MGTLYKAISNNNWPAAKKFIERYPIVLDVEFCTSRGETPLHVAVRFGHVSIVEELVRRVEPEYLEIYDALGDTPLTIAAGHSGVIPIAICLIDKNRNALSIPAEHCNRETLIRTYKWEFPVQLAFGAGLKEMGRYLYSVTPPQLFIEDIDLSTSVFATCLATGELDIVLDLLKRCKDLLFDVIEMIASHLLDSLDKSQLPFWKRRLYDC
ncbi:hypothetical protein QN277_029353 [Acacia crassicarpa]|uniref:Uncharacterized protein n=1 Tax=Acacia crassicarpa TaxID=499986 RepID=A0AAE1MKR7_9FABA|nr:hypothetical protein QN277_029353 [Acacia crassicarpa]